MTIWANIFSIWPTLTGKQHVCSSGCCYVNWLNNKHADQLICRVSVWQTFGHSVGCASLMLCQNLNAPHPFSLYSKRFCIEASHNKHFVAYVFTFTSLKCEVFFHTVVFLPVLENTSITDSHQRFQLNPQQMSCFHSLMQDDRPWLVNERKTLGGICVCKPTNNLPKENLLKKGMKYENTFSLPG